jgi:hypothetical protein
MCLAVARGLKCSKVMYEKELDAALDAVPEVQQ